MIALPFTCRRAARPMVWTSDRLLRRNLLVGVQTATSDTSGRVRSKVDPTRTSKTEPAEDFHPLNGVDLRMEVATRCR